MIENQRLWLFVIDMNEYAGFHKNLCSYCTGHSGEYCCDDEYVEMFKKEVGDPHSVFDEVIDVNYDECSSGGMAPSTVFKSRNGRITSVAIFFEKRPTRKQINIIKERAFSFVGCYAKGVKIRGFRLLKRDIKYDEKESWGAL